ncbi:MAG: DNA polymerase II large subunit [Candidatus Anstonellales archaeon]
MEIDRYFSSIKNEVENAYAIAERARRKGFDPKPYVEIAKANDIASRVEGLLELKGIASYIREKEKQGMKRDEIAFEIVKEICKGEVIKRNNIEELADIAIRVGTAILTEGVLVAPTEGIAKVKIDKYNGKHYIAVYYAGPIRGAGGTATALTVVLADIVRQCFNIESFRADEKEIERVIEEIQIYDVAKARLQYYPPEEHIRKLLENCPVCIDGEPTEEIEVSVNRDHPRIKTNRIRGGVPLVICEGLLQKSAKVYKYTSKLGLSHWNFIKSLAPIKSAEEKADIYLDGLVIGRPVFSYPSANGGFRLRYGRTFTTGIMAKAVNPATMAVLNNFIAYGTQLKIEKPGKSSVITACSSIDGPIVKLKDGSVRKLNDYAQALKLKDDIEEIIYLGDILVSVGDFVKTNMQLLKPGYVEEIWEAEIKSKGLNIKKPGNAKEAFEISKTYKVPLHPIALFFWTALTKEQIIALYDELKTKGEKVGNDIKALLSSDAKRCLELIGIEHDVNKENNEVIIKGDNAFVIENTILCFDRQEFVNAINEKGILDGLSYLLGFEIKDKAGSFIGARLGRPEKASIRIMEGKPNVIFPTGETARSLKKLYNTLKTNGGKGKFEIKCFYCTACKKQVPYNKCPFCDSIAKQTDDKHADINFVEIFDNAIAKVGHKINNINGVQGLMSKEKIPERLEKGLLRAAYGLYVFRDGTIRFDATNVALTHFYAGDAGIGIDKLKELGYTKDIYGNELENENQILELKIQDIIINQDVAKHMLNAAKFIDEELVKLYGEKPYYNANSIYDLIGKLVITLSPHTSAGNIARIIGFTKARVCYCHPYLICARRRNCDGDEDSIFLLMDGLLNFSKTYLLASRGGTMDSPLIMNINIDPQEVDDEVHSMDICSSYDFKFYEKAFKQEHVNMNDYESVSSRLGKKEQFFGLMFTHDGAYLDKGPIRTKYIELKTIPEKAEEEIKVMKIIRAVDLKDALEKLILSHFIPDIYGNLRKFSKQSFRCTGCNKRYRRIPIKGKCHNCNGNITLTIHRGGIEKYLDNAILLSETYSLSNYMKQRLALIKNEIKSLFEDDKIKQKGMGDFFN